MIIWSKTAQLGLEESSEVEGFKKPKYYAVKLKLNSVLVTLVGLFSIKSDVVVGNTTSIK